MGLLQGGEDIAAGIDERLDARLAQANLALAGPARHPHARPRLAQGARRVSALVA